MLSIATGEVQESNKELQQTNKWLSNSCASSQESVHKAKRT